MTALELALVASLALGVPALARDCRDDDITTPDPAVVLDLDPVALQRLEAQAWALGFGWPDGRCDPLAGELEAPERGGTPSAAITPHGGMNMSTHEHETDPAVLAAELRRALLGAIEQAVKSELVRFTNAFPAQPWVLDSRPGCPPLRGRIDQVLDAITQVLVRPVGRDHFAGFYDRVGLAVLGLDRD